jgi:Acetyltransferase (GNAT) family.
VPNPPTPPESGWWHCLAVAPDGSRRWFAVVASPRHPDAARVELLEEAAKYEIGTGAVCVARYDEHERVCGLDLSTRTVPPLWFGELRESAAQPPAVNLITFTGHGVLPGALHDDAALRDLPVASGDQLGAVRWYPATGELDQIYVQPDRRRRGLATALIAAAATLSYARDWPRLWSDGQRTELGERLRNSGPWWHRAADLTHVAPPMTPPSD